MRTLRGTLKQRSSEIERNGNMTIGGFTLMDSGYGLSVTEYEAGWSFWLQGDDADRFREEWDSWKEHRDNDFRQFLSEHDYDSLFQ